MSQKNKLDGFKIYVIQQIGNEFNVVARSMGAPRLDGEVESFSAEFSRFGRDNLEKIADQYYRNVSTEEEGSPTKN